MYSIEMWEKNFSTAALTHPSTNNSQSLKSKDVVYTGFSSLAWFCVHKMQSRCTYNHRVHIFLNLKNTGKTLSELSYRKVESSNTSRLEAHAGFFREFLSA